MKGLIMYDKYIELKGQNNNKLYLFKSGIFYIFLEDDAIKINKYINLKLTNFGSNHIKCGFPDNSYDKYMNIFKRLNLDIEEVKSNNDLDSNYILNRIKDIDINKLTPLEAFNIIRELKEKYE